MDPVSQLGLSSDSVQGYNIGEIHRPSSPSAANTPELLPCGYLVGDNTINIQLKGTNLSLVIGPNELAAFGFHELDGSVADHQHVKFIMGTSQSYIYIIESSF